MTSTTTSPVTDSNDPLADINLILGSKLRITMTDGRVVHGTFIGLDRLCNILLTNVIEFRDIAYVIPQNHSGGKNDGALSALESDAAVELYVDNHAERHFDERTDDQTIIDSSHYFTNPHNLEKNIYRWNTQRKISQAVIRGDRLARVEIGQEEFKKRVGRCTVSKCIA